MFTNNHKPLMAQMINTCFVQCLHVDRDLTNLSWATLGGCKVQLESRSSPCVSPPWIPGLIHRTCPHGNGNGVRG